MFYSCWPTGFFKSSLLSSPYCSIILLKSVSSSFTSVSSSKNKSTSFFHLRNVFRVCLRNKTWLLGMAFVAKKSGFSGAKYHFSEKNSEKCEYLDRLFMYFENVSKAVLAGYFISSFAVILPSLIVFLKPIYPIATFILSLEILFFIK